MAPVTTATATATPNAISVEATVVSVDSHSGDSPAIATATTAAEPTAQEVTAAPATAVHAVPVPQLIRPNRGAANEQTLDLENGHNITVNGQPLNDWEIIVLHYRYSVQCFAVIDLIFTLIGLINEVRYHTDGPRDDDGSSTSTENEMPESTGMGIVMWFCLLLGPVAGFHGAKWLLKKPTFFYVAFCVIKGGYFIAVAIFLAYFWYFVVAMVELWVLKITWRFYYSLCQIPEARAADLRTGEYQVSQIAYW